MGGMISDTVRYQLFSGATLFLDAKNLETSHS
jgi:hypothetical protein